MRKKKTKKEIDQKYYTKNRDWYREYHKEYYRKNKEELSQYEKDKRKAKRKIMKSGITGTIKRRCRLLLIDIVMQ